MRLRRSRNKKNAPYGAVKTYCKPSNESLIRPIRNLYSFGACVRQAHQPHKGWHFPLLSLSYEIDKIMGMSLILAKKTENGQRSKSIRQQATGNRQQATGNRQQATGNRQQAIIHIF